MLIEYLPKCLGMVLQQNPLKAHHSCMQKKIWFDRLIINVSMFWWDTSKWSLNHKNIFNFYSLPNFNCFLKAFFCWAFSLSLYLLTISLAKEKHLTVIYNLTIFSRHKDWHSFDIGTSQFSTMLHHKLFTRGEVSTSSTILSTGRLVVLSLFVFILNDNSDTSAILTTEELGVHSPPLESEKI